MSEIFNIQMESDLSEWTSETDADGDLNQGAAGGLRETAGGMILTIDDTTAMYCEKTFTTLANGVYRAGFYLDPNGMTIGNGDDFRVMVLTASGGAQCAGVELGYDGSSFEVQAFAREDDDTENATSFYDISDAEHKIEIVVTYAASDVSSDATLDLYIDGALQEQVSGLDIYDRNEPGIARLGCVGNLDAGTSGTLYLDEFILRDDDSPLWPGYPCPWFIYAQQQ